MKIKVTSRHIKKGQKGSAQFCPIALAVKQAVNRDFIVMVKNGITIYSGPYCRNLWQIRNVPTDKVLKFIRTFDRSEAVKPFVFDLPVKVVGGMVVAS